MYDSAEDSGPKRRFEPQGIGFRYDGPTSVGAHQPTSPTGIIQIVCWFICFFSFTKMLIIIQSFNRK